MITFSAARLSVTIHTGTVLDDVSFKAKAGELVGIIGPNGAGN